MGHDLIVILSLYISSLMPTVMNTMNLNDVLPSTDKGIKTLPNFVLSVSLLYMNWGVPSPGNGHTGSVQVSVQNWLRCF
jgi:predicted histidine transporter YuiF (NhaC family)